MTASNQELTVISKLNSPNMVEQIKRALPITIKMNPERFTRIAITLIRQNPTLAECSTESLLGGIMISAQLGLSLEPSLGQSYLVPYKDKTGRKHAQWQPGYRGYIELARRAGVLKIEANCVFEGDDFAYQLGTEPFIHHIPNAEIRTDYSKLTHAYAVAYLPGGLTQFEVLNKGQIEFHRGYSKVKSAFSPWQTNPIAMARKTPVRVLAKLIPCTELEEASYLDGGKAILKDDGELLQIPDFKLESEEPDPEFDKFDERTPNYPQVPPQPTNEPRKPVSDSQLKKIFATVGELIKEGVFPNQDEAKQMIYRTFNVESTKDLSLQEAASCIEYLENLLREPKKNEGDHLS